VALTDVVKRIARREKTKRMYKPSDLLEPDGFSHVSQFVNWVKVTPIIVVVYLLFSTRLARLTTFARSRELM
jgi:hypothetical protein